MSSSSPSPPQKLLLVGGGHAHLQVFHAFHQEPPKGCELTLLVDQPTAVYSGMVPGFVAGHYEESELTFDLRPWAKALGAHLILDRAARMDLSEKLVYRAGGGSLSYDLCSWNIGSTVRGKEVPGVNEFALATRPIGDFVKQVLPRLQSAIRGRGKKPVRILVVGAGAAGVELAFCLDARAKKESGIPPQTTLLYSSETMLPHAHFALRNAVLRNIKRRGLHFRNSQKIVAVHQAEAETWNGERIPFDLCVWATGAASHLQEGWIPVSSNLQVENHPEVFAVGDCAELSNAPKTPKAGVYAVRQGPILAHNLRAQMHGGALQAYQPQEDFLALLNLGDGRAIGSKWGMPFTGKAVMRLKDRIDRKFMQRFQMRSMR